MSDPSMVRLLLFLVWISFSAAQYFSGDWVSGECGASPQGVGASFAVQVSGSSAIQILGSPPSDAGDIRVSIDGSVSGPILTNPGCDVVVYNHDGLNPGQNHQLEIALQVSRTSFSLKRLVSVNQNGMQVTFAPSLPTSTSSVASITNSAASTPTSSGVAKSNKPRPGVIAGSVVGAVAAVAAAIGAIFTVKNLPWIQSSLATLLGLFAFRSRRLVFLADGDLPECQLAFFVTTEPELRRLEKTNLVWMVYRFGGEQREFHIDIPCWRKWGLTKLSFGSIEDRNTYVKVLRSADAPATLSLTDDDEAEQYEQWTSSIGDDADEKPKRKITELCATSELGESRRIVLGTVNEEAEPDSNDRIRPFLLVENFDSRFALENPDLYIHAFRVRSDCQNCLYGDSLDVQILQDRITPEAGIYVNSLKPLETWSVSKDRDSGMLVIKQVKNRKGDLRAFESKHKWKVQGRIDASGQP